MKHLLLPLIILTILLHCGCASSPMCIDTLFNDVLQEPDQDIVMCRQLRCDYNFEANSDRCLELLHWFEVVSSVKNFLMPGDIMIIRQKLSSHGEDQRSHPNNFQETPIVYIDIDLDQGKFEFIDLPGGRKYIFRQDALHGDMLNPARPGKRSAQSADAVRNIFDRVKKDFWQRQTPSADWQKAPRNTPEAVETHSIL